MATGGCGLTRNTNISCLHTWSIWSFSWWGQAEHKTDFALMFLHLCDIYSTVTVTFLNSYTFSKCSVLVTPVHLLSFSQYLCLKILFLFICIHPYKISEVVQQINITGMLPVVGWTPVSTDSTSGFINPKNASCLPSTTSFITTFHNMRNTEHMPFIGHFDPRCLTAPWMETFFNMMGIKLNAGDFIIAANNWPDDLHSEYSIFNTNTLEPLG